MKKTSLPKRLDDIAHIFKGVGHRDLFEGKRTKDAPKGAMDCRVVHAKDLGQGRFWFDPRSTGKASSRIFDKPIRGLGQKAVLKAGDILISTKGRPLTSPVMTRDMIEGIPLVAGAELLVIRPRTDIDQAFSPAHIRNLLEHPDSAAYLEGESTVNPLNRSLFFSKEALGGLPISKMRHDVIPFLEESNEEKAFAAETSTGKLHRILKAIMRAGSRRLNQQPPLSNSTPRDTEGLGGNGAWNTNHSIREILGQCASNAQDIAIEGAGDVGTTLEVAKSARNVRRLTLLEDDADCRKVAEESVRRALPDAEIHTHQGISHVSGDRLYDLVLFEATARVTEMKAMRKRNEELGAAGIFKWNGYMTKLKPGGRMVIHIPTEGWERLSTIKDNILAVIQTPPVFIPGKFATGNRYIHCSQGLIVVASAEWNLPDQVRVIDATKAVDNGKASETLLKAVSSGLARLAMGGAAKLPGVTETPVKRSELFGKYPKAWPGMLTLLNKLPDDETLSTCCTLETLLEEYRFHESERLQRTKEIFSGMGIPE